MPFIKLPGIEGWVYEPENRTGRLTKHNCSDCFFCQMCSDTRCLSCLKDKEKCREESTKKARKG